MRSTFIAAIAAASLAFSAGQASAQDYPEQIWSQLQQLRSHYPQHSLQNYILGHMAEDRTDSWTIGLAPNTAYVIAGVCDTDCADLDIIVWDADGNAIAQDELDDDVPIVELKTGASSRYTIEVKMFDCSANTCYFGFGLFRD